MFNRRRKRNGFVELEFLVAFLIVLSVLPILTYAMSMMADLKLNYSVVNDELALLQLRRIMLLSYDVENNGDSLCFIYKGKDFELSLNNNRLILSPGYQVFLDDVEDLYFYEEGNSLIIAYVKDDKYYQTPIYKTRGIYLDEFSDCPYKRTGDSEPS